MNRRRFLSGLVATLAAAPVLKELVAGKALEPETLQEPKTHIQFVSRPNEITGGVNVSEFNDFMQSEGLKILSTPRGLLDESVVTSRARWG